MACWWVAQSLHALAAPKCRINEPERMRALKNLWATDTVEWRQECSAGVAGDPLPGWWGTGFFVASCPSNQFDLPGKRYTAGTINPAATTSHCRAFFNQVAS
jgi:hypothetical protein